MYFLRENNLRVVIAFPPLQVLCLLVSFSPFKHTHTHLTVAFEFNAT